MVNEFWVNIYHQHYSSKWTIDRQIASYFCCYDVDDPLKKPSFELPGFKSSYRIHVKMKVKIIPEIYK